QYSQPIIERELSTGVNKPEVQKRVAALGHTNCDRCAPYDERAHHQKEVLKLPLLPTTTIGSFPQTSEVRQTRAAYKRNDIDFSSYQ
ncbi:5-methyltetrahydropteroyltriglutamate--homocysteine S-methyltransferase, partial [Vibrio alfacsensis]